MNNIKKSPVNCPTLKKVTVQMSTSQMYAGQMSSGQTSTDQMSRAPYISGAQKGAFRDIFPII